ncbi:MAG: Rne/Rng family ribonuclease [Planctomycetota bacterium]
MLINTVAGQECRIAIVQDNKLEELYVERASSASHVGNIYKGRITNIEPSIQAAFVDFGLSKNGFLHISDVSPQYLPQQKTSDKKVSRKRSTRQRPPIQNCLHRGQDVVVQLTKEGIGTKGPTMTTYLSIPGRLLVMMPGMNRLGVSRKIEDETLRENARKTLNDLKLPGGMGFILRTAGVGRSKRDLQSDLNYLTRLWGSVKRRIDQSKTPAEIYQESDLVTRTIRDIYNTDIERIICDDESIARKVREFLNVAMPRTSNRIELYRGSEGLFQDYGLEREIEKIYARRVELPSGGSITIEQTEALVAIDVNSGRFREHNDAETTALKINQEAADHIARQLRLRDMGGVIVMDFIDMREAKNRRALEKTLRDAMKPDRAKTKILRISSFGIVEMTRQRIRPSLQDSIHRPCTYCTGTGRIKSEESQALVVMRALQRATSNSDVAGVQVAVAPAIAHHLSNYQRKGISQLEAETGKPIVITANAELMGDELNVTCTNARGSTVAWEKEPIAQSGKRTVETIGIDEPEKVQAPSAEKPEAPAPKAKKIRSRGRRGGKKSRKSAKKTGEKTAAGEQKQATPPAEQKKESIHTKPKRTRKKRPRRRSAKKKPVAAAS